MILVAQAQHTRPMFAPDSQHPLPAEGQPDDASSVTSGSTTCTVSSVDTPPNATTEQPVFALQTAPLGSQKCAQTTAAAQLLASFKSKCKIAAGIAPALAARVALVTCLPNYNSCLPKVVPWNVHRSAAPKIATAFQALNPNDRRLFLAAALSELAPTLSRTALTRTFANADTASILTQWRVAMEKLPPSVRKNIQHRSTLQSVSTAVPAVSLLSVLALTQDSYQDLLCNLFGRIPTQFMRVIDDVADNFRPHMFCDDDTASLISLIFEPAVA